MREPRICFVIPYFGAWPFWMPFFLESCRYNPSIDWLLFSDCGIPQDTPENVRIVETSFADYCRLVSLRLGIEFAPDSSYKLCDIKPALGYVHQDRLQGYDFWAFGDIDVIYGDLREYFSAERLATKDLFSTHDQRVSGHLCLLRNDTRMREAFMRIPHWRERFNEVHQGLDEGAFSRLFIRHKNWPGFLRRLAARCNDWSRRSEFVEAHSTFTRLADRSTRVADTWHWRQGKLSNSDLPGRSLPYLHFMVWKNGPWKGREDLLGPVGLQHAAAWEISEMGWRQAQPGN
ncbi:hypothetical protein DNJ95_08585 [Stutzerimonas kirkiae]|uniref:Glycosyl transferase n=1 Tax=Stutzerimonas kirkiae TaxID=2211392 RepID=A0A4V2KCN9_9GAMM|nr:DUF6625 family protein [Stutzerimonas kirkiae]TBU95732.1 hypothetical protein DNJ96_11685 [Stutzerimonas kirkiae]TBV02723.1 hypothetical protein DNJ95_08585 [Stutzerimonas kirkiae]